MAGTWRDGRSPVNKVKMDTTILVVDDDTEFLDAIQVTLESAEYAVIKAENGLEALHILQKQPVQLILADIAMPGMNGYQLFGWVKQQPQWMNVPFIFLTARDLDSDIRYGKELGVDDYLVKPVQANDLLATIRGKLKRSKSWQSLRVGPDVYRTMESEDLCFGELKINLNQHRVWLGDKPIQLSAREFRLLAHLVKQPGNLVFHQTLIRATHGLETDAQDASRLLRPLVRSLRRKLGYPAGEKGCIESVRGVGYQFIPPA